MGVRGTVAASMMCACAKVGGVGSIAPSFVASQMDVLDMVNAVEMFAFVILDLVEKTALC